MHPIRFEPIFRRYLWGGRRLASELGKEIGDETCAESWEVVDRPEANSVVACGDLAGQNLQQLIQQFGPALLGEEIYQQINRQELPESLRGRFPLLLKFLDANKTLSVQVHPDDAAGLQKQVPDMGKTEAWYVMGAEKGSEIYGGLKQGVDRDRLAKAIESKTTNEVLHTFQANAGDCVFVPAGTVHAIGQGLLIAEIQQCSDTTYRLFDWNRIDADGNERDLHIQDALAVTDYQRGPVDPQPAIVLDDDRCSELVKCDKFVIHRWTWQKDRIEIQLDGSFRLLMVTDGEVRVQDDPADAPLKKGQTMLLPASMPTAVLECDSNCEMLEISVPTSA